MKIIRIIFFIFIFVFIFSFLRKVAAPILDNALINIIHKQTDKTSRPTTKEECLKKDGEWRKPGPWPQEVCMLKNKDSGKFCFAGFQCEAGQCISYMKSLRRIPIFVFGQCPKYKILFGCLQQVHFGFTGESVCLD